MDNYEVLRLPEYIKEYQNNLKETSCMPNCIEELFGGCKISYNFNIGIYLDK